MFMFNVTPHNKSILICDMSAYVMLLLKNFDFDPTDVRIYGHAAICADLMVPSLANDPQWNICLRQSRNAI
jgi:hypothetical protein